MYHRRPNLRLATFSKQPNIGYVMKKISMNVLYAVCDKQIMLWCDGREDECHIESTPSRSSKRRKKGEEHVTKREEKKQRVEDLAKELQELNKDELELNDTQYRLWARMIVTGIHASLRHTSSSPDYRSYS